MIRKELLEGFPVRCYKYRTGQAALDSLARNELYFASPAELNDILEGQFENASITEYAEVFNDTFYELLLSKGQRVNKADLSQIVKSVAIQPHQKEELDFRKYSKRLGILSTAQRPDHQAMWAYYCGNSCGVCFGLEWSLETAISNQLMRRDVVYTEDSRLHNRGEDFRYFALKVAEENPALTPQEVFKHILREEILLNVMIRAATRAVAIKHSDWKHESEIRLLSPHAGPLPLLREVLKEVIFARTDFEEYEGIVQLLSDEYPEVALRKLTFSHAAPYALIENFVK